MPSFHHGTVEIAYLDEGEGDPIVLVHGFASSKNVNWVYPTWVSELKKAGRRVIALDNRGHGDSGKLYDPAQYELAIMAGDVIALMDHLQIARADIMGYSLGSRMTAVHRFRSRTFAAPPSATRRSGSRTYPTSGQTRTSHPPSATYESARPWRARIHRTDATSFISAIR